MSNTDIVKAFYASINQNDITGAILHFSPDIVCIEPEGFPTAGTYRGRAEVHAHITRGRGTWAEGTCVPEGFFVQDDKVVVYLYAHVRLHGKTEWTGGRFADGFIFRNGQVVHMQNFGEREEALAWAGIQLASEEKN